MNQTHQTQSSSNSKNPLKFPSLGFFITIRTILEYIVWILRYAIRGFKFLIIETPKNLYNTVSGGVDHAYQTGKSMVHHEPTQKKPKKDSILNADIFTLLQNTAFMKKRMAKLEKQKRPCKRGWDLRINRSFAHQ